MYEAAIELENVSFSYPGGDPVLRSLSLTIHKGDIFGLLGPNGAGKSTAFRLIVGLDRPSSGRALLFGKEVKPGTREVYREVGYMPDSGDLFDSSSIQDLLEFFGRAQGLNSSLIQTRTDELLELFQLTERRFQRLRTLSRGLKQKAHIMRCLIHNPSILILDEPASNLDPVSRRMLLDILRAEAKRGTTILISSHILPELSDFCTSLAIIKDGRVLDQGRVGELLDKHQNRYTSYVLRAFSGLSIAEEILSRENSQWIP
jgi:ABC-2 type transport system ATP-binding protein